MCISVRLSSSFLPLNPWRNDVHDPPVFDVQSFGDIVAEPHSSFVNLMYIYPLALKYVFIFYKFCFYSYFVVCGNIFFVKIFSQIRKKIRRIFKLFRYDSQKVFSKARNISCTVRFIRGGEDVAKEVCRRQFTYFSIISCLPYPSSHFSIGSIRTVLSLHLHHAQSNITNRILRLEMRYWNDYIDTCTAHHNLIMFEMKLRLPLSLGQYDHLLFTFSHVSVMGQLNAKSPTDSVEGGIGYAWLPLVGKKERLLMVRRRNRDMNIDRGGLAIEYHI